MVSLKSLALKPILSCEGVFWSLGFRPFFLLGTSFAVLALFSWVLALSGLMRLPAITVLWHAHEMLHGFTIAIIVGFLFTASQNWTGIRGVHGKQLALLVFLWTAGRLTMLLPPQEAWIKALVDLAFLPACVASLARYLTKPEQRRNLVLLVALILLWSTNVFYHLEVLGLEVGYARTGLYFAVHVIIFMMVVIGGRVIPFFSERALQQYQSKKSERLDRISIVLTVLFVWLFTLLPSSWFTTSLAAGGGLVHFLRLRSWYDSRIWQSPMLLVLYAAYFWIVIGFLASAMTSAGLIPQSVALHAFTAGAISMIIVGMISRVSLGHTGRPIAANATVKLSFILIFLAGLSRIVGPLVDSAYAILLIEISGYLWSLGFAMFVIRYARLLIEPRLSA